MMGEEVGNQCLGAKVNHVMVNIDYRLSNGDQVEILTAKKICPKKEWLHYVTSPQSKRYIRAYLESTRTQQIMRGRGLFETYANEQGYALQELIPHEGAVLMYPTKMDFFLAIYMGEVALSEKLISSLAEKMEQYNATHREETQLWDSDETEAPPLPKEKRKEVYVLKATQGKRNYIRGTCCQPPWEMRYMRYLTTKSRW